MHLQSFFKVSLQLQHLHVCCLVILSVLCGLQTYTYTVHECAYGYCAVGSEKRGHFVLGAKFWFLITLNFKAVIARVLKSGTVIH